MGFTNVLKKMFPFVTAAASLGGPIGTMAATAVGSALGIGKVESSAEGISKAIADAQVKDPDALLKLQQAEQAFQAQMAQLGFDTIEKLERIDADDRASARSREIAVRDKLPAILAIVITGGFFGLVYLLAYHRVPPESQAILQVLIGSLATAWIGVVNYYFGSSSGSATKTEILARTKA